MSETAAPAQPANTSAATPAPAPASTGGFLDHIRIAEASPADSKPTPTAPTAGAPAAKPADGKPATPPAAAAEPEKTSETPAQPAPTPAVFKTTVRGREYTGDELAKAFELSSTEGLRLNDALKQTMQRVTAAEAKAAELQSKLDDVPPFEVLSKEQLKALDPADQTEYIIKKNAWESQKAARKEAVAKAQEAQRIEAQETKTHILTRTEHMLNNPAEFPHYAELMPVMDSILDRAPWLAGTRETPDILYYAALGLKSYREGKLSRSAEDKARQAAAAAAQAAAAAAAGGNPPAPAGGNPPDDDSDEAFNKRLLSKSPGRIFG